MTRFPKFEFRPFVHTAIATLTVIMVAMLFITPWWSEAAVVSELGSDEWRRTRLDRGPFDSVSAEVIVGHILVSIILVVEIVLRRGHAFLSAVIIGFTGIFLAFAPPLFDPLALAEYAWPYATYFWAFAAFWGVMVLWLTMAFVEFVKRQSGG